MNDSGFNLMISIASIALSFLLAAGGLFMADGVIKESGATQFRNSSFLLKDDIKEYSTVAFANRSDCEITNKLLRKRHISYARFNNSCEFIWAEADVIHRKFYKGKGEMDGVAIFEGEKMHRYYPAYKEERSGYLKIIGGFPTNSYNNIFRKREVSQLNNSLMNYGLY